MTTYEWRMIGDVHVLTPRKNLVGGEETVELTAAAARLVASRGPDVVLDLQRLSWVSSLGVEALRRIHRICAENGGRMRLACVGDRIGSVLLTMRLHWMFETFDTLGEAVSAPQKRVANR